MKTVNLHAAKTHLSRLVDEAANGEEIVIAKAGRPMVRLVPGDSATEAARLRRRKGQGVDQR
jgi:prevent-host-death family protein